MRLCPRCRLAQPDTPRCHACGAEAWEVHENDPALYERPGGGAGFLFGLVLAATGTCLLFVPGGATIGAAVLVGATVPLLVSPIAAARGKPTLLLKSAGDAPPALSAPAATGPVVTGEATALGDLVTTWSTPTECLACALVTTRQGALVLRAQRAAEIIVRETQQSEPVLVTGALQLELPGRLVTDAAAVIAALELPKGTMIGDSIEETVLEPGVRVEVFGAATREQRVQFATGYRDGGDVMVVRGTHTAPAIVRPVG